MQGSCRKRRLSAPLKRLSTIGLPEVKAWCLRRIPILEWAPKYDCRQCLIPDLVSGIIMALYQVLHGLAFALLCSVHPIFGLYGSFFPGLIYAIFGMGRHTITGTFAIPSLIGASAVERLVPLVNGSAINGSMENMGISDFEMRRVAVAATVTFVGGIIQMSLSVLQLGCITFLFSEPVVSAVTTGAATQVLTSQIKYLIGMDVPYMSGPLAMFHVYVYIFKNINAIHVGSLLLSLLSIAILILTKELNEKYKNTIKIFIPIDIILIVVTTIACYFANMKEEHGFNIIGHIPAGILPPRPPPMDDVKNVLVEGFALAFIGYAVSVFLAYNSAKKFKYTISENQELLAHGLSNAIPSFFYCIPNAGAPARTLILFATGSQTQVTGLVSCALILFAIYFATPIFFWIPVCVLSSVIVVGLKGMLFQFRDLEKYWNTDKYDWLIWVCTYVLSVCFAANVGMLFGLSFSVAVEVFRLTRIKTFEVNLHEDLSAINEDDYPDLKLISVGSPLYFLNAKKFRTDVLKQIQKHDKPDSHQQNGNSLLLQRSHRSQNKSLKKSLFHCSCEVKEQHFFNSVASALEAMQKTHGSSLEAIHTSDV
ncbi:anion exchange transporter [Gastrophryne carolinensis]